MTAKPQRKMVAIDVVETSAVDHPAHLREGWLVKKSATQADIDTLFGSVNKAEEVAPVANTDETALTQEAFDALVSKNAELEKTNAELVAKAAETPAPAEDAQETLLKSVPQEVRDMIAKAESDAKEARAEIAKERDARLDAEAVSISKAAFKTLSFDHAEVAPALRRLAVLDENLAKSVTAVLKAAEGQLESAGLFSELGKVAKNAGTPSENIDTVAKSLQAEDTKLSYSQAVAKALEANPGLYTSHLEGK